MHYLDSWKEASKSQIKYFIFYTSQVELIFPMSFFYLFIYFDSEC